LGSFSITAKVRHANGGPDWWLTIVNGPTIDQDKPAFLSELREIRQSRLGPWLLSGDFNMMYGAKDKSNDRLDRRWMGQFRRFLNDVVLKEIHLNGRLYTWSNEWVYPMLERIDCAFITNDWEDIYP
jgi:hypothetical protein